MYPIIQITNIFEKYSFVYPIIIQIKFSIKTLVYRIQTANLRKSLFLSVFFLSNVTNLFLQKIKTEQLEQLAMEIENTIYYRHECPMILCSFGHQGTIVLVILAT